MASLCVSMLQREKESANVHGWLVNCEILQAKQIDQKIKTDDRQLHSDTSLFPHASVIIVGSDFLVRD